MDKQDILKRIATLSPEKRDALEQMIRKRKMDGRQLPIIPRRKKGEPIPLSYAQERLWFLAKLEPKNPFYNVLNVLRFRGPLHIPALTQSINEIRRRHDVLRTTFVTGEDGLPVQIVSPMTHLSLPMTDLQSMPEPERSAQVHSVIGEEVRRPFDLAQGPLLRVSLLQLAPEENMFLSSMHHIVCDGWSMGIFVRELTTLYEAFSHDLPSPLPELPIQYADVASWQRRWLDHEELENQLIYWKRQLADMPPASEIPTDRARPSEIDFRGATERFDIHSDLTQSLNLLSRQSEATLFMTVLAAFSTLLCRYSGQKEIILGTPVANRRKKETEPLIGFFVNTLVIRTDLSGNPTFRDLLKRVRKTALDAYSHQDMPFEKLVEALQPERNLSHTPLFQVMLALHNVPSEKLELAGLTVERLATETLAVHFDLNLMMTETESGLSGILEYKTRLFDAATIRRMIGHFQTLLKGIVANPHQRISDLPLLTDAERHQLLVEFNNTRADYPHDKTIVDLFEEQVEKTPNNTAVIFEDTQLTYGELNIRANHLACQLQSLGAYPESVAAICVESSPEMIVGLMGILKAGAAYMPIDPEYPKERILFMLKDSTPKVLLTQKRLMPEMPERKITTICLDGNWQPISVRSTEKPVTKISPENLAYVIYTSGSTGIPKGVMIEHKSIVNTLLWRASYYSFGERDRVLQLPSYAFDSSVEDIFTPLISGSGLVLIPREKRLDTDYIGKLAGSWEVTHLLATPALYKTFLHNISDRLRNLRFVTVAGESVDSDLAYLHFQRLKTTALFNEYGPTENSVCATVFKFLRGKQRVLIGKPISNNLLYILDQNLQLCPMGVPGELHIGGAGLARGYLNRPELTEKKFVPDPFNPEAKIYRTGDLCRWMPDGNIEYLGRNDFQVKIRGFRIELGEIENRLTTHEAVREAVVVARAFKENGNELVAYVGIPNQAPNVNDLRDHLRETLPDYMIPSYFVRMEKLPLNPSGKIDRKALPDPADAAMDRGTEHIAPRDEAEKRLADIWQEVLGLSRIGIQDNFFESGGHSLKAVQMVSRIHRELDVEIALREIFSHPTIERLAERIRSGGADQKMISEPFTPLIPIHPNGEKLPIFCVHPINGEVFCYAELSSQLGKNQPFYGLKAFGLDPNTSSLTRVEEMARKYLEAIRSFAPQGSYLLGGFSIGGLIAYEMALQLQSQGQKVPLLILMDTSAPHIHRPAEDDVENFMGFAHDFGASADLLPSYCEIRGIDPEQGIEGVREDIRLLSHQGRMRVLWECGQKAGILASDIGIEHMDRSFSLFTGITRGIQNYTVQPYPDPIILFRAADEPNPQTDDPTLGWARHASDIKVYDVPGAHFTMLTQPHVRILAEKIKSCIE